jgi:hypothetical protein
MIFVSTRKGKLKHSTITQFANSTTHQMFLKQMLDNVFTYLVSFEVVLKEKWQFCPLSP